MNSRVVLAAFLLSSAALAQQITVDFDPAKTAITWTLDGTVHTVHGTFQLKEGHMKFDPVSGAVSGEMVVDLNSGDSGNGSRDKRMKKEILETARYPEAKLTLSKVEGPLPISRTATIRLNGQFSIHGAVHEITIPLEVSLSGTEITGEGKFAVPFVDWGMKDPSNFFVKVNKSVIVEVVAAGHVVTEPQR